MADNTRQFEWIVLIKKNLDLLFDANPAVFVAGDLLWYPVQGNNTIRQAPMSTRLTEQLRALGIEPDQR